MSGLVRNPCLPQFSPLQTFIIETPCDLSASPVRFHGFMYTNSFHPFLVSQVNTNNRRFSLWLLSGQGEYGIEIENDMNWTKNERIVQKIISIGSPVIKHRILREIIHLLIVSDDAIKTSNFYFWSFEILLSILSTLTYYPDI